MADIKIDTGKLQSYSQRLSAVNSRIASLDIRLDSLYWRAGLLDLWNLMQADLLTSYSWRLLNCQAYLEQTAVDFSVVEQLLLNEDPTHFDGFSRDDMIAAYSAVVPDAPNLMEVYDKLHGLAQTAKPYAITALLSQVSPVTALLYITSGVATGKTPSITDPSRHPHSEASGSWFGYEFDEDNPGVSAWIGKGHAETENEWGHAEVTASVGKVDAEFKNNFSFMEGGESEEEKKDGREVDESMEFINAELGLGVSVTGLALEGEAGLGSDMLGVGVAGEGSVGNAKLNGGGKFSVTDEGVNAYLKGEALVSAAEGEASGTINILGIEITGKVGGYAGAVGVEGQVGVVDNKFVMEGGAAAVLGVSFGVEIGFNDEGWDNFVDYLKFWD